MSAEEDEEEEERRKRQTDQQTDQSTDRQNARKGWRGEDVELQRDRAQGRKIEQDGRGR